MLKLHQEWTDNRIAQHIGVSNHMVADRRKAVFGESPNTPPAKRVGKDGREFNATKPPKAAPPKPTEDQQRAAAALIAQALHDLPGRGDAETAAWVGEVRPEVLTVSTSGRTAKPPKAAPAVASLRPQVSEFATSTPVKSVRRGGKELRPGVRPLAPAPARPQLAESASWTPPAPASARLTRPSACASSPASPRVQPAA